MYCPMSEINHLAMITSTPLVSIIMPAHNSEQFIGMAIDSVLSQTYQNWELIVVNDNSTDSTCKIVEDYEHRDSRISLYNAEYHNGMPSAPRNTGVNLAKGRFISFLDSDDLWTSTKLEEQVPLFANENVVVVYSNYEKIDEDGKRSNRIVTAPSKLNYAVLLHGNAIGNLTGIYDTQKVGKIKVKDSHHEDYAMWLEILSKGGIGLNTNSTTAFYRLSKSGISRNKIRLLSWQWQIYRNIVHLSIAQSIKYYLFYAYYGFKKFIR